MEKFFLQKVPIAPYKALAISAFYQLFKLPYRIMKECLKLMQIEQVMKSEIQDEQLLYLLSALQTAVQNNKGILLLIDKI